MKCIVLAAGYATRLYPLTKNQPKPLLPVAGVPILEHILRKVERVELIDGICIVTNDRFYRHFEAWRSQYKSNKPITIINDGTTDNENRLGAIADLRFALDHENIHDDILVMAGDNLFDFELTDFVDFFLHVQHDCITVHELQDEEALKKTGVVEIDERGKVLSFEEKPTHPRSNLAAPPFYLYRAETLDAIRTYLEEGGNPDAPGNLIPWLIRQKDVYAYRFEGQRYDIGTPESYQYVQQLFSK